MKQWKVRANYAPTKKVPRETCRWWGPFLTREEGIRVLERLALRRNVLEAAIFEVEVPD